MIRSHFGIKEDPFSTDAKTPLLVQQQRHFDILKVHSQQGGLCVLLGEPGMLISTLSSYFLPVFDRIDIVTIQSYFGSINSGAFGNASKILGSGAAPQM